MLLYPELLLLLLICVCVCAYLNVLDCQYIDIYINCIFN